MRRHSHTRPSPARPTMHPRRHMKSSGIVCAVMRTIPFRIASLACWAWPAVAVAQQPPRQIAHPQWSRSAVLYEVNVRQYTPEGTLAAFERQLPRTDSLGVDIYWIMPVQPIGKLRRKGPLGSYYSVQNYTA